MATPLRRVGTIYISKSTSVHLNLAFEEFLFRSHNLDLNGDALLFWSNKPAVVIGRYQNPWLEADLRFCENRKIDVVRRFSGGGAVYHDLGNLNFSFLTSEKQHNRPANLRFIRNQLNTHLGTEITINERDDLLLPGERKVSGTAARISRGRAYHHLTLLVDTDLAALKRSLSSRYASQITTNATRSTRARAVGQLNQEVPGLQPCEVSDIITAEYCRQFRDTVVHEVEEDQMLNKVASPTVPETLEQLKSAEWTYRKTPNFTLAISPNQRVTVDKGFVIDSTLPGFVVNERFPEIPDI